MKLLIKNVILQGKTIDLFVEKDRIEKIGNNLNLKADEKIDGKEEKAILPGLINCHTHSPMTLFRGYSDDLPLKSWLEEKIWPIEKYLTEDDIYWGTKLACLEMIKTGTTCFNDMYWRPEAAVEAVKEAGVRAVIGLIMVDFSELGSKKTVEKNYRKLKNKNLKTIKLAISPHAIYTVSRENLIFAKNFARKNNLILHIHLSETEKEVKGCLKKYNLRPVEFLEKIGFLCESTVLAHSIWLSGKETEILKKRKCSAVYCPCSNMKLASGIFPFSKMEKEGINICLGTDGPASNNNLDLFEEMKFASLLQKISTQNPRLSSSQEIFKIATKNGARALKIQAGEIEKGKLADLILVDLNQVSLIPGHNLISDLIFAASGFVVSDVICNGKILMRERSVEKEGEINKEAGKRARNLVKKD